MQHYDILIVGGGPGGSTCARRLIQCGARVGLIDRRNFPRDKTCAGWVTPEVWNALELAPEEYGGHLVCQPITGFITGMIGRDEVQTDYERAVSYGIRRCEFDHFLLIRSGVECHLGQAVKSIEKTDSGWTINDELTATLLVGAGGHFCPVARRLGGREIPGSRVVAAQEIEFEVPQEELDHGTVRADVPEIFFCQDLRGYGWCFRKGNYLNIGLGRLDKQGLSQHVVEFNQFLRDRGKVVCPIPDRAHGHAYQLYERVQPKLVDDGVLLIGDAAGLAYPQSGEGIRPAVESGLLAADVIANSAGDVSRDRLNAYEERLTERLGAPRRRSATDYLPHALLRSLASRLLSSRWYARNVVLNEWFLHANTPALTLPT